MKRKVIEFGKVYISANENTNKLNAFCIDNKKSKEEFLVSNADLNRLLSSVRIIDAYQSKIRDSKGNLCDNNLAIKISKVKKEDGEFVTYITKIIFINYSDYSNYPFFENIKSKIYPLIKKHREKRNKEMLKTGLKRLVIMGSAVGILFTGTKLYKNGIFSEKEEDSSPIFIEDSSPIIIEDSSIVELENSGVDSEVVIDDNSQSIEISQPIIQDNSKELEYFNKFYEYASYYNLNEELKNTLYNNFKSRIINCDNMDLAIMESLYNYYENKIYNVVPISIVPNIQDNDIQCCTIIKYAKMKGITDPEILYTMLAVHNFETYAWETQEYGKSELCVQSNNFGGNVYGDTFQIYPTFEVGAYDFVCDFLRIYNNYYTGVNTIEYDIGSVYCTENMEGNYTPWYQEITDMKNKLKQDNKLEYYYKMMNEMNKEKVKGF